MLKLIKCIANIFLPPRCLRCGKIIQGENGLCDECFSKIKFISVPYCQTCGHPLPTAQTVTQCPSCIQGNKNLFRMQRSRVHYDENSRALILNFKFYDRTENAEFLARWLYTAGHDIWQQGADVLIPVPIHQTRLRSRKFNQSALLCKELSKITGIPVDYTSLQKYRKTKPQVECSGQMRIRNIKNAFIVRFPQRLKDKRVVVIDDVMTTGSTLKECAKVLRASGVKSVDALTVARVLK